MTTYIALLRAINLAGHNQVSTSRLTDLLTALGFLEPRSLLQSGNLIFRSRARRAASLERMLESEGQRRLDLRTDFMVRTADEWRAVVARNPFRREAERDPAHLLVVFLKDAVKPTDVKGLQEAITGPEIVRADGRHAYIIYPDGVGRSRLTNALIEKKLGTRGTARNWNTVLKIAALTGS